MNFLKNWTGNIVQKNLLKTLTFKYRFELIFLAASALIHAFILILPTQLAFGDFAPFPESWKQGFDDFFYAWREISFGIYRHPGNITNLLQSALILVFGTPLIAQKVYAVFLLPFIAFASIRHLLKRHFGADNNTFLFIISFFYAYSPTMITEFVGGTQYSTMLIFALFPYLAALTIEVLLENSKKSALWLTLALSLLISIDIQLLIIYGIFLAVAFSTIFFSHLKTPQLKRIIIQLFVVFLTIFLSIISNPIHIMNNLAIIKPPVQMDTNVGFTNNFATFLIDVKYTYSRSSFLNTIRLGSNLSDFKFTGFSAWTTPILLVSLFTLLYSLLTFKNANTNKRIFIAGYVLVSLFIYFTYLGYTYPIFNRIPLLFIFRNPAKLTLLNTVFFCVCFYNTFGNIRLNFRKLIYPFLYFSVLLYVWPLFLLDRGLALTRNSFTIPKEYYEIKKALKSDANAHDYRTIWIPSTYEGNSIKLTWLDRGRIEDQLGFSEFATDNFGGYIVKAISNSLLHNEEETFKKLISAANIKYVVLTKDDKDILEIKRFYTTVSISSGYIKLDKILSGNPVIYESNGFKIYKINNTPTLLYKSSASNELNYKASDSIHIISNYYKFYDVPITRTEETTNDLLVAKSDTDDLSNYVLEWDKTWSWPEPTVKPENPLHSLVLIKERLGFKFKRDKLAKINIASWLISKRAAEITRYNVKNTSFDKLLANAEYYGKFIESYYQNNEVRSDLERDTVLKTFIYLSKTRKHIGSKGAVLDSVINILNKQVEESFTNLCVSECIKVKAATPGKYYEIETAAKIHELSIGKNRIDLVKAGTKIDIEASTKLISPFATEVKGLQPNKKYALEFDYETKGEFYNLSLAGQYLNATRENYDVVSYISQRLTSDFKEIKHFKAFFQISSKDGVVNILKAEVDSQIPSKPINITNLTITEVPSQGLLLIRDAINTSKAVNSIENVDFYKKSPSEYKIKTTNFSSDKNYLIFAANYNPLWKLYNEKGEVLANHTHKMANSYANSWELDGKSLQGSEYITLKFEAQKHMYYSYIFSLTFIIILVLLLRKRDKIN